jgi:hypothetical protein
MLIVGIVVTAINTYIGVKIKARDEDIRKYREAREKKEEEGRLREELAKELTEQSTRALIRVELRENYIECRKKGYYSMSDREVFHPLYRIYKDLDGNGIVEQWRDELVKLPVEEPIRKKIYRKLFKG